MKCKYKLNLTPLAVWNTIVVLSITLVFYIGVIWVVSNVSLKGGVVSDTYFNHKKPLIIISESMEPTIMTNSLLVVSDTPYEDIQVGDIILVDTTEHGLVIHRAVDDLGEYFITKGDNNEFKDNWVVTKDIYKGKVETIHNEVAGFITFLFGDFTKIQSIRLFMGFIILAVIIAVFVIIVNWLYDFIFIAFFLRKSYRKGLDNIKCNYFNWIYQITTEERIDETISELGIKRTLLQELIFRYRLMRWYNAVKEEEKQVKKVNKRYMKLKGGYKK